MLNSELAREYPFNNLGDYIHLMRGALLEFFKNQRKANLFLISLVTISLIALLDARISRDLSLSLFYLLPVFLTAWYLGGRRAWR